MSETTQVRSADAVTIARSERPEQDAIALLYQKSYPTVRSTDSQENLVALPAGELARVIVSGSLLLATAPQKRVASRQVSFLGEQCTTQVNLAY
jgi:hypothetical protein